MKIKNSKYLFSVLLMFILSSFYVTKLSVQDDQVRKNVYLIAERDFKVFLERIPIGMEANYGFSNRNEIEKATLGKPINVLFLSKSFYSTALIDSSILSYEISPIWEVPILVNGHSCCLLRMKALNNNYSVIGFGGSQSAVEIEELLKKIGLKGKDEVSLLQFPELMKQYLIVYDTSISYRKAKCYLIGEEKEPGSLVELSLPNIFSSSKKALNDRKGIENE